MNKKCLACTLFYQEKCFTNFAACSHWQNFCYAKCLSCVIDCREYMVTYHLGEVSKKFLCNTKVARLGKILKISDIVHVNTSFEK